MASSDEAPVARLADTLCGRFDGETGVGVPGSAPWAVRGALALSIAVRRLRIEVYSPRVRSRPSAVGEGSSRALPMGGFQPRAA